MKAKQKREEELETGEEDHQICCAGSECHKINSIKIKRRVGCGILCELRKQLPGSGLDFHHHPHHLRHVLKLKFSFSTLLWKLRARQGDAKLDSFLGRMTTPVHDAATVKGA